MDARDAGGGGVVEGVGEGVGEAKHLGDRGGSKGVPNLLFRAFCIHKLAHRMKAHDV